MHLETGVPIKTTSPVTGLRKNRSLVPSPLRKWALASALAAMLALAPLALAQPPASNGKSVRLVDIKTSDDARPHTITVRPSQESGFALVELVNTKTKAVERVLYAGTINEPLTLQLKPDEHLKPGMYSVRVRDGIEVVLDKPIARPDAKDGKWVNPTGLCIQNGAMYLIDAGLETPPLVFDTNPEKSWVNEKKEAVKGTFVSASPETVTIRPTENQSIVVTVPFALQPVDLQLFIKEQVQKQTDWEALRVSRLPVIIKMNLDGSKITNWGTNGILYKLPVPPAYLRTFTVDEAGIGYLPSTGHHFLRVGQLGLLDEKYTLGGWDGNPAGPVCTVNVHNIATVSPKKVYIPSQGYQNVKVYDPTKPGFEGILYSSTPFLSTGAPNGIAADTYGNVYLSGENQLIHKYSDNGKAVTFAYSTDPELKLCWPTGITTSGSLVLFACRGPGPGPFWDSGGGGEFVVLWDNGTSMSRVIRFGAPGFSLENKEFLNPSAISLTADHSALIVVEDGLTNLDGPPGNARVTRFKLKAAIEDAVPLELKPTK